MNNKKNIQPADLVCMNAYESSHHLQVDLAYADPANVLLEEAVYRYDAKLWLYKDLAQVVLEAARICHEEHGMSLVLYDGLRTVDAQALMLESKRVQAHPEWLEEPNRLLSPPGRGAHPRGMAIDLSIAGADGTLLDMGTPFDDLTAKSARDYLDLTNAQGENRHILDHVMQHGADICGVEILPLPQEWWDYRLPQSVYGEFFPLHDTDLPVEMRMTLTAY